VLSRLVDEGLAACDMVILSGGTSKGASSMTLALSFMASP
jgi:molybdopterin biosynthesis enzyme